MRENVQGTQTHKSTHSTILRNEWRDGGNEERMKDASKLFLIFMLTPMTIVLACYWPTVEGSLTRVEAEQRHKRFSPSVLW